MKRMLDRGKGSLLRGVNYHLHERDHQSIEGLILLGVDLIHLFVVVILPFVAVQQILLNVVMIHHHGGG